MDTETRKKVNEWLTTTYTPIQLWAKRSLPVLSRIDDQIYFLDEVDELLRECIENAAASKVINLMLVKRVIKDDIETLTKKVWNMKPRDYKPGEITPDMIERAKEFPLEDILTDAGVQVSHGRCKCPIHGGKNPSSFSIKNNFFSCHSCHESGDAIKLAQIVYGIEFKDAVKRLVG